MSEGCRKQLFRSTGEILAHCGQIVNCKLRLCPKCSRLKGKKTDENSGLNGQKQVNTKGKVRD